MRRLRNDGGVFDEGGASTLASRQGAAASSRHASRPAQETTPEILGPGGVDVEGAFSVYVSVTS